MTDDKKTKLPQNMQNLLMEIGEKSVLFRIYLLTKGTDWNVFYNLGEVGCDLILINMVTNQKIKIEVKTRQRIYTTSDDSNITHFTITELERNSSEYIICYWYEENAYFIVPSSELKETSSNGKSLYKFVVRKLVGEGFNSSSMPFLNDWELIKNRLI